MVELSSTQIQRRSRQAKDFTRRVVDQLSFVYTYRRGY
jgi:hypothetical protein